MTAVPWEAPEGSRAAIPGGHLRASNADRARTAASLRTAFDDGRIDRWELAERLDQVSTARTYAQLAAVTSDLPGGGLTGADLTVDDEDDADDDDYLQLADLPVTRTNTLAGMSLIFGLGGLFSFGIAGLPALPLAIAALTRIMKTGERGTDVATAGGVLGGVSVLLLLWFVVVRATP
jgi:uncharacterized protein DUF1707/uncharacterized protein DUF4190